MKPYQSLLLAVSIFASATSMAQSPADTPASAAPTLDELNKQYLSEPDYSGKKLVVVQESYGDSSGSGALRYSIRDVGSERQHFAFSARNPQFLAGVFKLFFGDEQKVAMFRHLIEARQELDNDSKELQSALGFSVRVSEGDRNTVGPHPGDAQ